MSESLASDEQSRSTAISDGCFSVKTKSLRKNFKTWDANSAEASGEEADMRTCTRLKSEESLKN